MYSLKPSLSNWFSKVCHHMPVFCNSCIVKTVNLRNVDRNVQKLHSWHIRKLHQRTEQSKKKHQLSTSYLIWLKLGLQVNMWQMLAELAPAAQQVNVHANKPHQAITWYLSSVTVYIQVVEHYSIMETDLAREEGLNCSLDTSDWILRPMIKKKKQPQKFRKMCTPLVVGYFIDIFMFMQNGNQKLSKLSKADFMDAPSCLLTVQLYNKSWVVQWRLHPKVIFFSKLSSHMAHGHLSIFTTPR